MCVAVRVEMVNAASTHRSRAALSLRRFASTNMRITIIAVGDKAMNGKRLRSGLLVPLTLLLAACGGDADEAGGEAPAVETAADASVGDLAADASTADAMSVDVAAGGVEPMTDPAAAAAEAAAAVAAAPAGQPAEPAAAEAPPAR
jgi:hypothetical protein